MNKTIPALALAAGALAIAAAPYSARPLSALIAGRAPSLSSMPDTSVDGIAGWWSSGAALTVPEGVAATFLACLAALGLALLSARSSSRGADGGVLGNARVKEGAEAIRGSETWDGRGEPASRGFVYGFARGRYLYEPDRHVFLDGATGSGKSRFCLIPTLDLLTFGRGGHTVVVSDVKNELVELCGEALEARGYRVLLLDAQHPMRGDRFNPIRLVADLAAEGRSHEAEQAADSVAETIVQDDGDGRSSHWAASARSLLSAAVLYVAFSPDCPDRAHMATVNAVVCRGTEGEGADPSEPLKALFRGLDPGHPARARASQLLSSGGNELRSVLSTLKVQLRPFASAPVAWMTSGSDIDPRRIVKEKTALFLHVLDEGSPYNAVSTILLDQLYAAIHAEADGGGGGLERKIAIVGDEWGNLPRVRSLPSLLSLGRSYGVFWMGAVQNVAQLNKYGERDGRKKVLANCGVKVALKLGEEEDRRYFTELVGKTTRRTRGTSTSRGASGRSGSTSYSEHADDLIHAWEWTGMAPDRDGAVVVKAAENGVPASRAGAFRTPLVDCTRTPTKDHFGLGTREHERERRRAYQAMLAGRAEARASEAVEAWCPEWPGAEGAADDGMGGWDGLPDD